MSLDRFFALRGKLPERTKLLIELSGALLFLIAWQLIVQHFHIRRSIMPSPLQVAGSFRELWYDDALLRNLAYSFKLNVMGYIEAAAIAFLLGFPMGLYPFCRAMTERLTTALRFLPLTALIGCFMLWFGISHNMKIQFLTTGIVVYLLPVVVQRIDEVQQVYVDTVKTLGATRWKTICSVFIPDVVSRLSDDVRVLVAISWTYIIIAEVINLGDGGVGAMAYRAARMSRVDKVFAIVLVILLVGWIQDRVWVWLDRKIFPHKYA